MKSLFRYTLWLMLASFVWASCTDEELVESGTVGSEEVAVTLDFTAQDNDRITVTTRATLEEVPESRVQNFFLFFFVNGTRVYSHYFDRDNRLDTEAEVIASDENNWYVKNKSSNTNESDITKGTVRAHVPQVTNATLYMVANIDADMVNISPEKLNTIRSEQELKELAATLNQEITSRNGYFPMSGKLTGVTIDPAIASGITVGGATAKVILHRLDAKVEVYVRAATDYETVGTENGVTTTQKLTGFVPESWRVVNLPKSCYVVGRTMSENDYDCTTEYFNTNEVGFELSEDETFVHEGKTYSTTLHGFSFYMMENRPKALASVNGDFHLRDMREKDATTGAYINDENDEPLWKYAPGTATYLEIKGEVEMDVDVSSEAKTQTLKAAVVYYIHLGDIANDLDDYSVNRNTHYKYTITIKGVDKITLEVETSQIGGAENVKEENAGATGNVYIAKESMHTFDAHYGQRVFCFDAAYIEAENMTWFVQTPFGKAGTPPSMDGVDIPAGYDYKWVEFLVNEETESVKDELGKTLEVYSQKNQPYPGYKGNPNNTKSNDLMDVIAFTKYVKEEKVKLDKYLNGETATNTSVFRQEFDEEWYRKFGQDAAYRWRIYVTVFVNEFYYEEHPITGDKPTDLWKQFVNQPNRIMHILCDSQKSLDEASSSTGSIVTIRQRSIQTPYNLTKEALQTAWGCETVDETAGKGFFFYSTKENVTNNDNYTNRVTYNNSEFNGRYNTAVLWTVLSNNTSLTFNGNVRWDTYLNYERPNDYVNNQNLQTDFLRDDYAVMRYAPMMRNRDNNGNGTVDADEIRWYIASIDQLYGLYFGQLGLSSDAILYSVENAAQTGNYASPHPYAGAHKWRLHIVSSSSTGGNPVTLWGEEGISVSNYGQRHSKPSPYSIRCVRNLGMDYVSESDALAALRNKDAIPTKLVRVIEPSSPINSASVYKFDLTNINDNSLRFYTTRELEPGNEHSEMSRLFYGFQTGTKVTTGLYQDGGSGLYYDLVAGESPCPDGWRVPNVREGALMSLYCSDKWWDGNITVSSYYSNGTSPWGNNHDDDSPSWQFNHKYASIATPNVNQTRTVQDWYPDE